MGSCQCHPVVICPCACPNQYDLRKRHEKVDPFGPLPSARTPVEKFDSLRSRNENNKIKSTRKVSPRDEEKEEKEKEENVITITADQIIQQHATMYECDSISDKSNKSEHSDKDSDLGSECLSTTQSSSRSNDQTQTHTGADSVTDMTDEDDNSLASEALDQFDCSQSSGFFGTISERPYMGSRLGKRQTSHTSQDSREILYWKKGNRLGRGSFGTVWLGLMPTGELIAVKEIELIETSPKEVEIEYAKIYQEVSLLKEFRHKNIVGYYGSSYEKIESRHVISVFMQYVPGGTLSSIIQKFGALEESITSTYSRQLMDAVAYLHNNNIVHRDIKSANILLMPEGIIKLIDFGCAKRLAMRMSRSGSHLQQSLKGTPYWMAPEVINETGHGKKSDVWSVGCTVYELLTGKPPWGDRAPLAAIYAIGSDEYPVPLLPETFTDQAKEFVRLCLIRDKHKRPPALRLLSHSFLKRPNSATSNSSTRWGHRRHDTT